MSAEVNAALCRRFFESQDRLKGGPAEELCASGYTAYIGGNPPVDHAGHHGFATMFYSGFPDLYHMIDNAIGEDEKAAFHFTLRGTHTGDFMGIPATGRSIEVSAIGIMAIADGKVEELRAIFDQTGMMAQLGVLPGPAATE